MTSRQELNEMTVTIQQDFDRLQVQKEAEIKHMLVAFAKIHVVYCEQVSIYESGEMPKSLKN